MTKNETRKPNSIDVIVNAYIFKLPRYHLEFTWAIVARIRMIPMVRREMEIIG